ncbi:MAG: hypothetical protein ACRD0H_06890, partial [Actinomycetes bacterium]
PDLCVGTLVLDRPVHGPVHVGEVVTFRPPGTRVVYTHRVVQVLPDGSFKTAGDALTRVDPWTVPPQDVVGRVAHAVRGLGWLWHALPWMAAATACIILARRSIPSRLRRQADLVLTTLLVVVPTLVLRPLLRESIIALGTVPGAGRGVVMKVVNTGLLPAQFQATGGSMVTHVAPGQIVKLLGTPQRSGSVSVHQAASFFGWQWVVAAAIVLLPILGYLAKVMWTRMHPTRLGGGASGLADPSVRPAKPAPPPAAPLRTARHVRRAGPGAVCPRAADATASTTVSADAPEAVEQELEMGGPGDRRRRGGHAQTQPDGGLGGLGGRPVADRPPGAPGSL